MNNKRVLSFVLDGDYLFDEIVIKFSELVKKRFSIKDDEGRYIAIADVGIYTVSIIDKFDRLSDCLCDDNCVFEVLIEDDDLFDCKFETDIKNILANGNIKWESFVWAPERPD
ncbi:hypothetical protein ACN5LM_003841 [Cronobacter dublinensis]